MITRSHLTITYPHTRRCETDEEAESCCADMKAIEDKLPIVNWEGRALALALALILALTLTLTPTRNITHPNKTTKPEYDHNHNHGRSQNSPA